MDERPLRLAAELSIDYLGGVRDRPVGATSSLDELRNALSGTLQDEGEAPDVVVETLARLVDPGLVASAGPRFFGFVIGGSLPAALAADWLTSAWDQNAGLYLSSAAAAVVEETVSTWLLDLLGLPASASVGFVTGATMANFTGLAAGRHEVLRKIGWDVETRGLIDAPAVTVIVGEEAHATLFAALQYLGLGRDRVIRIPTDGQGRMRPDELRAALAAGSGPTIVCAQAGNVHTGAFDPIGEIGRATRDRGAWLHVDGAFGLWAAASPELRHLVDGIERADSWATDAHKWLNVPYDSGLVFVAEPAAHRAAMTIGAPYLTTEGAAREPYDWTPEFSRRARGFAIYAALRSLGRRGVAELVERCSLLALRMAERLAEAPGVELLNDVVLNQVLVRFLPADAAGDPGAIDAFTHEVIGRVQADGTCWLGGTTWQGMTAMRISISNWSTEDVDIDRSAEAIIRASREAAATVRAG